VTGARDKTDRRKPAAEYEVPGLTKLSAALVMARTTESDPLLSKHACV